VLRLPDAWIWDFWLADDGARFHLFFLRASRALGDPDRRHFRASVGHAVSTDLRDWRLVTDALVPAERPAFDDIAIWTGSVVPGPDGTWHMFYTAAGSADQGLVQRIGMATSTDLMTWRRHPDSPVLDADPRWYERLGDSTWTDQAWRDPWVFADPGGDGWHMLITARANRGPVDDRGVLGHARSPDLVHWTAQPPLTEPGAGFGQLEVPQVAIVDGRSVLVFSCLHKELAQRRRETGATGGVWAAPGDSLLGPFDIAAAQPLTDDRLYSARLVADRDGRWQLLAFRNRGEDGRFAGELTDPVAVAWSPGGVLETAARTSATRPAHSPRLDPGGGVVEV
jgi:beta-fructofuranosidase